jgi:hypothetical protein
MATTSNYFFLIASLSNLIFNMKLPPQAILVSDWSISKKSSHLKPLGQINRHLVCSLYGRYSLKNAHLAKRSSSGFDVNNKCKSIG